MQQLSIIGATSPLGIDLTRSLLENGCRVCVSFREESRLPADVAANDLVTPVRLDLRREGNYSAISSPTVIWLAHLEQGRYNNAEIAANTEVFEAFLQHAEKAGIERVVFVSSGGSVYGVPEQLPIREDEKLRPLSSYGKAKAAMEELLLARADSAGIKIAVLRPGNIYGFSDPNRDNKGVVAAFIAAALNQGTFTLIHRGKTIRDFVHVDDVTAAIRLAAESEATSIVWNVATGIGTSIADVINEIVRLGGLKPPAYRHIENYSADVEASVLSLERITSQSIWRPTITLDAGLRRTLSAYGLRVDA